MQDDSTREVRSTPSEGSRRGEVGADPPSAPQAEAPQVERRRVGRKKAERGTRQNFIRKLLGERFRNQQPEKGYVKDSSVEPKQPGEENLSRSKTRLTLRKKRASSLKSQPDILYPLLETGSTRSQATSSLELLLDRLSVGLKVPCCAVYLLAERELVLTCQRGFSSQFVQELSRIGVEGGWLSKLTKLKEPLTLNRHFESQILPSEETWRRFGVRDWRWVALRGDDKESKGLLLLASKEKGGLIFEESAPIWVIAEVVASAIETDKLSGDLQALLRKYLQLYENASESYLDISPRGTIAGCNQAAVRLLGYPREELTGIPFSQLVVADDLPAWEGQLREACERGRAGSREIRLLGRNIDKVVHVEVNLLFVDDEKGKPGSLRFALRDIGQQKLLERTLKRQKQRFEITLQHLRVGVAVIDRNYRTTYSNRVYQELFGKIDGQICFEALHRRQTPCSGCRVPEVLAGEEFARTERLVKDAAGSDLWAELITTPLKNEAGEVTGVLNIVLPVTERKIVEQKLEDSARLCHTLVENTRDLYWAIEFEDPDNIESGKFVALNHDFAGFTPKSLLGQELRIVKERFTTESWAELEGAIKQVLKQGDKVRGAELASVNPKTSGIVQRWLTDFFPLERDERIVGVQALLRDITEKRVLELELASAQKMKSIGILAGGIAHDFNNILGGILGYASMIKSQTDKDSPFYKELEVIEASALRAADLTSRLLAFGREGVLEQKPLCLNSIVEEVLHLLSRTLGRGITIEKRLGESLPPVEGDATQLQQVILNICINASEAMPNGGTLTVTTRGLPPERIPKGEGLPSRPEGCVLLSIKDTGLGMPPEIRERLFEPFFTTKKEGGGTGLGLALVYSIVKQHRGFVEVESEPKHGTEFKIYLPISSKTEPPTPSPECQLKGGSETILMVDDDEVIRDLTAEILQKVGYTVHKAASGKEALLALKSQKGGVDLAILDMIMPGLEGGPTFERLRQLEPEIKILLTSGYNELSCPPGSLEKPGTAFIQKPYRVEELLTKVREVLEASAVLSSPS